MALNFYQINSDARYPYNMCFSNIISINLQIHISNIIMRVSSLQEEPLNVVKLNLNRLGPLVADLDADMET